MRDNRASAFLPLWGAFVLAGAALAVACLHEEKEPLRVGVNAWPPFELLYLARDRGFLRDAGVGVDLVDFSSYTGVLRSYHQGNIDAFFATLNEVLILDNFQDPPAVVLVADYSFGGDALVVRDGLTKLSDLRSRKLAFEESALGSYVLERVLDLAGLTEQEVTTVNRLPEEGEMDFQSGAVDAVITYQPALGRLLRTPGARSLFTSRDIPGEIVDVLVVRRTVLKERADEVRRILSAWFQALDLLQRSPGEAAPLMAAREHLGVAEYLASLAGAHVPDLEENRRLMGTPDAPGPLHQTAERVGAFLVRRGLASRAAPASEIFHPELIDSL